MNLSLSEQRTAQFYHWETRCRGWTLYDAPVDLEPTFVPFFFRPVQTKSVDDGIRPTIASTIVDLFTGKLFDSTKIVTITEEEDEQDIAPYIFDNDSPLEIIRISFPKERKIDVEEMEHLLCMLSYTRYPLSFEIIASHTSIVIQLVCHEPDLFHVQSQIKAYFPDCILNIKEDVLLSLFEDENAYTCVVDFGLSEEFMRPINMTDTFDLDPFIGLFGILENMKENESAVFQVLFQGAKNSWSESIIHSVTDYDGKSFFMDAPEMVELAHEKISSPLYGVTVKVLGTGRTFHDAANIAERVSQAVSYFSRSSNNALLPLVTEAYSFELRLQDVVVRQSHRQGMILNGRELATLVHYPSVSVVSAKLERNSRKTKTAPDIATGQGLIIGRNIHQGKEKIASQSDIQRLKHTHIIGATGTGKSTLLLSCIVQDIQNGQGIAVLDPHGDLIESVLSYIPPERMNDVIIIDPADAEFPVGFNILSAHSEVEKDILSSDLVAVFRRLSTSWGDQMNSVFANAILAFLESNVGGTLVDLRRFLIEKPFRDAYLKTVTDPSIIYYWQKEFPLLKSSSIGPILTRLDTFLRPKLIRYMVAQKTGPDFEHILDSKKILLVKLSQGLIGAENSYLLGTFIVSKIQQAAMARQIKSKESRSDFYLYIDEFQNFITPSMSTILSGARKYHLGLILAHQDMQQLVKQDSELASSVVSNAGTRICFRVGDTDAKRFEDGFSYFDSQDLQNLETGEAIARIERPEYDFTISTIPLPEIETSITETIRNMVIAKSREKYGTPKKDVEALFEIPKDEIIPELEKVITDFKEEKIQKKKEIETVIQPTPIIQSVEVNEKSTLLLTEKKAISQHRYLQTLIKKMAESRGYKANIEEPTPDGKGRVDVSLERNGKKIACEICMTTTEDWEIHNIEKCFAAGYEIVVECSNEKKTLENIRRAIDQKFDDITRQKILIVEPDAFFLYLDEQVAKDASTETLIKGYRVKVEYNATTDDVSKQKKDSILKVISDSMRKKK